MPKLPRITSKKILAVLVKAGFFVHHHTGSHANLRHEEKKYLHIVVPVHRKNLAPKTLKSILIQAEISVEDLIIFLKK